MTLGYGWNGFDDVSGVWFVPEQVPGALNQLFMHCPFRGGTGVTFAEFAIDLPRANRIRVAFEIALRSTATNSDGATYRVKVDGKCLFEQHCNWRKSRSFQVDLTPYAGRQVVLRLEVDPGPKREPREDWSLWRNVRLLAGTDRELAESQALLEATLARRREEAVLRGAELAEENLIQISSLGSETARPGLLKTAINSMHDVFYLTVSSRYEETLANVPHRPSPFLDDLSGRVVLDVWRAPFAEDENWLEQMVAYGVNRCLIIKHVWQRDGYDRTYPNTMPANEALGGDTALRSLSQAARQIGHRFCVHENFYDYYPNAEDFRPEHCALDSAGKPQRGWDRGPVVASILKPSLLMSYARKFSPEVKRRYDCDAAYHDIMPTWRVDFDADAPGAGKIRFTHEVTRSLCDYDRELFGGPVVFEAATAAMAGVYEGGCNHGRDTYKTPAAVAYELLKVHPKMSNHGFGYYERWLPWGYNAGWGT